MPTVPAKVNELAVVILRLKQFNVPDSVTVPLPLLLSKNTSSDAVGTAAAVVPPLVVRHGVVTVDQLPVPLTQYQFAIIILLY